MFKSGLIVGGVSFILAILAGAVVSPLCGLCVGVVAGLAAGYVAGLFDKPADSSASTKAGAGAGAIAGIGGLIGLVVAGGINAIIVGPEGAAQVVQSFGLETTADPTTYYISAIGLPCCIGLFNIALMAGLGALGGMLWYQTSGKNRTPGV
jgi:hypothetical protein